MALNKVAVPLNFSTSVDKSEDSKLEQPAKFSQLQNLEFDRINTVRQRGGLTDTDISHSPQSPDTIRRLHAFNDDVLIEASDNFYNLLPVGSTPLAPQTAYGNTRTFERTTSDLRDITSGSIEVSGAVGLAYSVPNKIECWAWAQIPAFSDNSSGTLMYKLVDTVNGVTVAQGVLEPTANAAGLPVVVARTVVNTTAFYIYYLRENGANFDLCMKSVSVTAGVAGSPSARNVIQASYTTVADGSLFDVQYDETLDAIGLTYVSATTWTLKRINGSDGKTVVLTGTTALGGPTRPVVTFSRDNSTTYIYAIALIGTDLKAFTMNATSGATTTGTVVSGLTDIEYMYAPISAPWANNSVVVFYQRGDKTDSYLVRSIWYTTTPANGNSGATLTPFATNVTLNGRPFVYHNGGTTNAASPAIGFYATLLTELQSTGFVMRFGSDHYFGTPSTTYYPPAILAKVRPGVASFYNPEYALPNSAYVESLDDGSDVVHIPILRRGRAVLSTTPQGFGGAVTDQTPKTLAALDVTFSHPANSVVAQRTLFLAGANPAIWDGERIHEAGFHFFPEDIALTQSTDANGHLTLTQTYYVVFTYEWTDAKGVTHRSAPSVPVGITLTGTNNLITATVPNLGLTDKQWVDEGFEKAVSIVPWISTGNPAGGINTLYYRSPDNVYNYPSLFANTLTSSRASISLGYVPDSAIIANELLYTTGGAFENEAFPPSQHTILHQRRLWSVLPENVIQYTDEIDERFFAPATSESYQITIPFTSGKVTSLASMDDKLVVFCERQIYVITGEGPNRLGQQSTLSQPQCVSSQLGCPLGFADSVILEPNGVWFYSDNDGGGVRMLSRNLTIQADPDGPSRFLGAAADEFFSSATNVKIIAASNESKSQLRWYIDRAESGLVVVYNYEQRKFSTFTPINSAGGAIVGRGSFWHADDNQLFKMSNTPGGLDASVSVPVLAETAWIEPGGKLAFDRIYRIQLLAELRPNNQLTLEVGYDYEDEYNETATFTKALPTILQTLTVYEFSNQSGSLFPGDTMVGNESGATGVIVAFNNVDRLYLSGVTGTFKVGENVTDTDTLANTVCTGTGDGAWQMADVSPYSVSQTLYVPVSGTVGIVAEIVDDVLDMTGETVVNAITGDAVSTTPNAQILNIEHHLQRQKCTAVRFRLTVDSNTSEVVRFSAFTLQVGVKKGLNKIPTLRRF